MKVTAFEVDEPFAIPRVPVKILSLYNFPFTVANPYPVEDDSEVNRHG